MLSGWLFFWLFVLFLFCASERNGRQLTRHCCQNINTLYLANVCKDIHTHTHP